MLVLHNLVKNFTAFKKPINLVCKLPNLRNFRVYLNISFQQLHYFRRNIIQNILPLLSKLIAILVSYLTKELNCPHFLQPKRASGTGSAGHLAGKEHLSNLCSFVFVSFIGEVIFLEGENFLFDDFFD